MFLSSALIQVVWFWWSSGGGNCFLLPLGFWVFFQVGLLCRTQLLSSNFELQMIQPHSNHESRKTWFQIVQVNYIRTYIFTYILTYLHAYILTYIHTHGGPSLFATIWNLWTEPLHLFVFLVDLCLNQVLHLYVSPIWLNKVLLQFYVKPQRNSSINRLRPERFQITPGAMLFLSLFPLLLFDFLAAMLFDLVVITQFSTTTILIQSSPVCL